MALVLDMRRMNLGEERLAKILQPTTSDRLPDGTTLVQRHEIFDDGLQTELESMYRDTGAGKDPVCPAMMAMAVLLQGYVGASDAEAVELTSGSLMAGRTI